MTETDEALDIIFKEQEEGKDVPLYETKRELSFCSLIPRDKESGNYKRKKIPRDYERASEFFSVEIDNKVNALNFYDDIDNAFIVKTFGKSDYRCFRVLSEFRKVISANITKLAVYVSTLLSFYILVNIFFAGPSDILGWFVGKDYEIKSIFEIPLTSISFNIIEILDLSKGSYSREYINRFAFGLISFIAFYFAIGIVYRMGYLKEQQINAARMEAFLRSYLSELANRSEILVNNATISVTEITNKKRSEQMSEDITPGTNADNAKAERVTAAQFIETLHWTALRALFIEKFLRNVVFQIKRSYSYSVIFIPIFFFLLAAWLGFQFLDPFYYNYIYIELLYHSSFYLALPLLIWSAYDTLSNSINPVQDVVNKPAWRTFRSFNVINKMKEIMDAYEGQLEQWRSKGQF